jgi:menaquinone-dependent protoporphyrinogen oxidase
MPDHVLVAYATRTGSTGDVAARIAGRLCAGGLSADARPVAEVPDLAPYSAAVFGSAIRFAAWLPEMVDFVGRNRPALRRMPVALFSMHMLALGDSEADRNARAAYTAQVRALITPMAEASFAGAIDTARLGLADRIAVRLVRSPTGDLRDWAAIEGWADSLVPLLSHVAETL